MELFLGFLPETALVVENMRGLEAVEHEGNSCRVDLREDGSHSGEGRHVDDGLVHPLLREKFHPLLLVAQLAVREERDGNFTAGALFHEFLEVHRVQMHRVILHIAGAVVGHFDLDSRLGVPRNHDGKQREQNEKSRYLTELHCTYPPLKNTEHPSGRTPGERKTERPSLRTIKYPDTITPQKSDSMQDFRLIKRKARHITPFCRERGVTLSAKSLSTRECRTNSIFPNVS